jgi:cell division septal protein FtsQ
MQKRVTINSNIRTTHKYGNILQMKIEKYNNCMHIYVKIYPQLETNRNHTSAKMY